jgi:hypothetical protein
MPGMVVHACNPSTQEAEAILGYRVKPRLKNKQKSSDLCSQQEPEESHR